MTKLRQYIKPGDKLIWRDLERWHVPPDARQYESLWACNLSTPKKDRKAARRGQQIHVPVRCYVHPFRHISECIWSTTAGSGFPANREARHTVAYWRRMARINQRWSIRSAQADLKAYRASQPDQVLWLGDIQVNVWYPEPCCTCSAKKGAPCRCAGRHVRLQKVN